MPSTEQTQQQQKQQQQLTQERTKSQTVNSNSNKMLTSETTQQVASKSDIIWNSVKSLLFRVRDRNQNQRSKIVASNNFFQWPVNDFQPGFILICPVQQ